jgi:hypothetical protein
LKTHLSFLEYKDSICVEREIEQSRMAVNPRENPAFEKERLV